MRKDFILFLALFLVPLFLFSNVQANVVLSPESIQIGLYGGESIKVNITVTSTLPVPIVVYMNETFTNDTSLEGLTIVRYFDNPFIINDSRIITYEFITEEGTVIENLTIQLVAHTQVWKEECPSCPGCEDCEECNCTCDACDCETCVTCETCLDCEICQECEELITAPGEDEEIKFFDWLGENWWWLAIIVTVIATVIIIYLTRHKRIFRKVETKIPSKGMIITKVRKGTLS